MSKLKIFTSFIVAFIFLFLTAFPATAADLKVDCPAPPTTCSKSGIDPLFSRTNDGYWYPGKSLTKTINLENSSLETREMAIKGNRTSLEGILEDVMHISIIGGTTVVWSGSVADFYNQDKILTGIFDPDASFDYDFTVSMSVEAGDDYQNKETVFDLTLGFWGEPVPTPTPTTTPVPTATPTSVPGAVLGVGVSAPVCTDVKPGVPSNFVASAGPGAGEVTLSWTPPTLPYTYFLIAYSDSSDWPPKWGNPDVGNVASYTVSGLGSGTYWFWLRAGNGCMPGDFVGPISPGVIAGAPVAGPVAPGFLPGVLGVEEEEILGVEEEEMEENILGEIACEDGYYPWWLPLLGQAVLGAVGLWLIRKRKEEIERWWLIPLLLALVSQIIHEILGCNCATGDWCPRYWLLNLGILILSLLAYRVVAVLPKKE